MPIAETCQVYRGFPPGPRPEEMCKVLIAGSDEQVASARRGFWLQKKKSGDSHFLKPSFQHSKKKQTNTFCTFLHHFYMIYPSNIKKKTENPRFFFHANLAKPIFSRSPFDADPLQGAGGIPGGRGAADYGVAQVRSLNVGDVVWMEDLGFCWSHIDHIICICIYILYICLCVYSIELYMIYIDICMSNTFTYILIQRIPLLYLQEYTLQIIYRNIAFWEIWKSQARAIS